LYNIIREVASVGSFLKINLAGPSSVKISVVEPVDSILVRRWLHPVKVSTSAWVPRQMLRLHRLRNIGYKGIFMLNVDNYAW
jgi:hypothetical protein